MYVQSQVKDRNKITQVQPKTIPEVTETVSTSDTGKDKDENTPLENTISETMEKVTKNKKVKYFFNRYTHLYFYSIH